MSPEEFNRLLEQFDYTTCHGYRIKIVVLLLQDTGMRIGECLEIEVDQTST
ncbi:tyrosine-type recombinase/integrase [Tumebacillus amylolyticus]|uniref:tyrosine-type recombinase/integrase n=1 Tax=Tumebacillus amylolyticus TaxID=2801339 RepID=UPI003221A114